MTGGLDLVVRGGTAVLPGGPRRADVGIAAGRIVAIGEDLLGEAPRSVDARGLHLFPGAVDAHVHLNEPGRADWEGFASGSAALAAGGATSAVDMPINSSPPTTSVAAFEAKRRAGELRSRIDFGIWGGIAPGQLGEMDALAELGVVGFKAFMCESGVPDFPACDEESLRRGMARAAALGLVVAVHAESEAIVRELTARAVRGDRRCAVDFLATRPVEAELAAIRMALSLAAETGCALHVVHVSCGAGVALVAAAAADGLDVSCETCPHYLVLTEADFERLGAVAKCAPPLRSEGERESLWEAIRSGALPMVASDHSPAPAELKRGDDLLSAWGGIAGGQSTLTLLLSEGHHLRRLPLELIAELASGFPARRFGLPGKGRIELGADADLALVALDREHVLAASDLLSRHRLSPYLGRPLRGQVVSTILRGELVFERGQLRGEGRGRFVRRGDIDMLRAT